MLRALVLLIGLATLAGGVIGLLAGAFPPAAVFAVWGVLIVIGTLYERYRYKPAEAAAPGPEGGWERTEERFVDDETGRNVTVYVRKATGERKYVNE